MARRPRGHRARPPRRSPTASSGRCTASCRPPARSSESSFFERVAALFTGHDLPDEALVRACLQSYRSRASTADRIVTGDDLLGRAQQHAELIAHLADGGHRLGMSVWIGRREQARKLRRRRLGDWLDEREQRAYLAHVSRAVDDLAEVDCVWYVRGRAAFLFEVEWTAMLGEPLLRRARPDPAGGVDRPVPRRRPGADRARPPQDRAVAAPPRGDGARQLARPEVEPPPGVPRPRRHGARRPRAVPRARPARRALAASRCRCSRTDRPRAREAAAARPRYPDRNVPTLGPPGGFPCRPPTPRPLPSTRSPTASGRRSSSSTRRPPRVYGDERYADRLEDPSPAGRAKARELAERTKRRRRGDPGRRPLGRGPDHPRHADRHRRPRGRGGRPGHRTASRVVDQIGGPQTLLPQICQFQPADTPERLEKFLARLEAYPAFMAANIDILREGLESGLTAPRIVAERTDRPARAAARDPDRRGDRAVDGPGGARTPTARRSATSSGTSSTRPTRAFLDALRGDYLAATREEPGLWSAPGRRRALPDPDPSLDDARPDAAGRSTRSASRSSRSIEVGRREIARAAGFGDDTKAYRAALAARPREHPELEGRADRPGARGHRAGDGGRAALLRDAAEGRLRGDARSRSSRSSDAPFAYYFPPSTDGSRPGIYYANGYDLPSRKYTKLASTTYHEAVPGHHFQIALEMENPHLNTFRRLGARIVGSARTSRAGACTARSSPTRWACSATRASGSGCSTRSPGGRPGSSSTPGIHALRWDAPALDRLPARRGPVRDRRGDRDRPLHRLAGPGPDLHDRLPRDRAAAPARSVPATATGSTCASSTTRSWATARCRSRPWHASCRTGSRPRPDAD